MMQVLFSVAKFMPFSAIFFRVIMAHKSQICCQQHSIYFSLSGMSCSINRKMAIGRQKNIFCRLATTKQIKTKKGI